VTRDQVAERLRIETAALAGTLAGLIDLWAGGAATSYQLLDQTSAALDAHRATVALLLDVGGQS